MSDLKDLKEIMAVGSTPKTQKEASNPFTPVKGSTVPVKPEAQPGDRWIRTKFCWCPPDALTDCRFHSTKEPGWETCPYEFKQGKDKGRWLWISRGAPLSEKDLSVGADIKELSVKQQHNADRFVGEIEPLEETDKVEQQERRERGQKARTIDLDNE